VPGSTLREGDTGTAGGGFAGRAGQIGVLQHVGVAEGVSGKAGGSGMIDGGVGGAYFLIAQQVAIGVVTVAAALVGVFGREQQHAVAGGAHAGRVVGVIWSLVA
jgi:hypothetical protein